MSYIRHYLCYRDTQFFKFTGTETNIKILTHQRDNTNMYNIDEELVEHNWLHRDSFISFEFKG